MSKNSQKNRGSHKSDEMAKPNMREARKRQGRTHRKPNVTTRFEATDEIRDFCTVLADADLPEFVSVHPSGSKFSNWYKNAEERVAAEGVVYGSLVIEWPSVLLKAELHAVWQMPDGRLGDVTPTADAEGRVLFLRDLKRRCHDRPSTRVYGALTDDAREHVRLCERRWSLEAEGYFNTGEEKGVAFRRRVAARIRGHTLRAASCVWRSSRPFSEVEVVDDHRIRLARPTPRSVRWRILPGRYGYGI